MTEHRKSHTMAVAAVAAIVVSLIVVDDAGATATGTIHGQVHAPSPRFMSNAIAYIEHVDGTFPPPQQPVEMDQVSHQFVPHALPVVVGTTVRFLNNDPEAHNVYSPDHERYDLGNWTQGQHRDHTFNSAGVYTQLCHLHPSMLGFVLVLQNPFFARVDGTGSFTIPNVPPGNYKVKVWQERMSAGPIDVTVAADATAEVQATLSRQH